MGRAAGQRMVFGLSVLIRAELIFMRVFTETVVTETETFVNSLKLL